MRVIKFEVVNDEDYDPEGPDAARALVREGSLTEESDDEETVVEARVEDVVVDEREECRICWEAIESHREARLSICCGQTMCVKCVRRMKGVALKEQRQVLCAFCRAPSPTRVKDPPFWDDEALVLAFLEKRGERKEARALFYLSQLYGRGTKLALKRNRGHSARDTISRFRHPPQNLPRAKELLKASADLGDVEAQFLLGRLWLHGEIFRRDYATAGRYFKLAAAQRDPRALLVVAYFHKNGLFDHVDLSAAQRFANAAETSPKARADVKNQARQLLHKITRLQQQLEL